MTNTAENIEAWKKRIRQGKSVVLGLGVSNRPLIEFLLNLGAEVEARDKKTETELGEYASELRRKGVRLVCGEDYLKDIHGDLIFRSPGIRPDAGDIPCAVREGALLLSEMELFLELIPDGVTLIGITGSDGKTTTTTLTSEFLKVEWAGRRQVFLGGNIGTPLLPRVNEMRAGDFAVVELSSFQLQTMKKCPDRAAVTNITPNHLNWHTGMDEYTEAKTHIYLGRPDSEVSLNAVNEVTVGLSSALSPDRLTMFSARKTGYGALTASCPGARAVYESDGWIVIDNGQSVRRILKTEDILLPGRHNVENYMTAISLTDGFVSPDTVQRIARTFPGVEHRLEFVREWKGIRFYNSSIDSSPTRTEAALSALKEAPIVICGGYDKHIPFAPLAAALYRYAKAVVLTGATAPLIDESIRTCPDAAGKVLPVYREPDFDKAVRLAAQLAHSGDTVLLSPACASFDAFPNFEVRGRHFKDLVNNLD